MDIDYAIRKDKPTIIDTSAIVEKALYEQWERSNRLSHDNVKALLKAIDKQFVTSDKARVNTLIMKFSSLRLTDMSGRYQSNPGINHWKVAKKVMRYRQGTKDYMLMYRRTDNLEVISYSDSDYVGYIDSRRSTSRYVFMLTGGDVSWRSAK
ncbi:uncharacterized protein LOC117905512 [Vitis riparia]|uniref:uncharacterized protein LOC117905512 n=1 Tax=Vitis riparia TaxID=96939 RepID=UPI00155B22A0|nr:uncharacterized protein LOC117905512 [Vitis riparia]